MPGGILKTQNLILKSQIYRSFYTPILVLLSLRQAICLFAVHHIQEFN